MFEDFSVMKYTMPFSTFVALLQPCVFLAYTLITFLFLPGPPSKQSGTKVRIDTCTFWIAKSYTTQRLERSQKLQFGLPSEEHACLCEYRTIYWPFLFCSASLIVSSCSCFIVSAPALMSPLSALTCVGCQPCIPWKHSLLD